MARSFAEILHGGPVDLAEVERVRETLVFEGPRLGPAVFKFLCLLVLASSIATYGLLGDSLAVVIGAMIVAPLMLPIMGLAFSISIGDRAGMTNTLLVSLAGIAMAVGVGYLITLPLAPLLQPQAIQQIMVRTAPHLLDLMAALATGVAGAFALSRRDVSDTLPGVAIAVSLVPPLANVGILLALKEPTLATGSLLLFITNYVAILITGSLVFLLMGFRKAALSAFDPQARRRALALATTALLLILIPLSITSHRLIVAGKISTRTASLAREWLQNSGYRLLTVDAETADGSVNLLVAGSGALPPIHQLNSSASPLLFGRRLTVKVLDSRTISLGSTAAGT